MQTQWRLRRRRKLTRNANITRVGMLLLINAIARQLNTRPKKILDLRTPTMALDEALS